MSRSLRFPWPVSKVLGIFACLLGAALTTSCTPDGQTPSVVPARAKILAILGDNYATGAAAAQENYDRSLWAKMQGQANLHADAAPAGQNPRYLWPSQREYQGVMPWISQHLMLAWSRLFYDAPQASGAYLAAREHGFTPENILLAADDGARIHSLLPQVQRVLLATGGILPEEIWLQFSGNDLCGNFFPELTTPQAYGERLREGLRYLLSQGKVPATGTKIVWLEHLPLSQLLLDDSILNKPVEAFGKTQTCKELRASGFQPNPNPEEKNPSRDLWQRLLPPNPVALCRTLYGHSLLHQSQDESIGKIAGLIRSYREAAKEIFKEFSAKTHSASSQATSPGSAPIEFIYLPVDGLKFSGEDIAPDCANLSVVGQRKLAGQWRSSQRS